MQAQQIFEDLAFSHPHESDSSISEDIILQHKTTAQYFGHFDSSDAFRETIDADEEIAKLIYFFVNRESQVAAQARTKRYSSVNEPALPLPPAIRFRRANRKTKPDEKS
jgi:hypothetical protein